MRAVLTVKCIVNFEFVSSHGAKDLRKNDFPLLNHSYTKHFSLLTHMDGWVFWLAWHC